MIEVLLIVLVAGGVIYYLYITFQEYLSNEENQKRFNQEPIKEKEELLPPIQTLESKISQSEYGVLAGILGYVANADGEICLLEQEMAFSLLQDMAQELQKLGDKQEVLEELKKIFTSKNYDIQKLCEDFSHFSKGEYKKKIKVVEFCFALGYADGILNEATKEAIIDVAAMLELSNEDFNALYEDFDTSNEVEVSTQEAKEIFGEYQDLHQRYEELIKEGKQNILDEKNLNKPITQDQLIRLRKIQKSYEILKDLPAQGE